MQAYGEFRPTGFDPAGLGLENQQQWLVVIGRNRDSGILDESNFACALKSLGGESDTVQVHRFGHWACGWFEIIIVDPSDEKAVKEAESIDSALSDYPVLSDEDYSQREMDAHDSGVCEDGCSACEYDKREGVACPDCGERGGHSRSCDMA